MKVFLRLRNFFSRLPGHPRRRLSQWAAHHPMDELPNEILAYVFSLIILDPEEDPSFVSRIVQVCRRWRELAIATAGLWSRIVFTFPVSNGQIVYAAIALERSASHPLSILLDFRDPEWDWEEDSHRFQSSTMDSIVQLLQPQATRWRKFDILTDTWIPIYTFLRSTNETRNLPMLESLSLSRCNAYFAAHGQSFQPESLRSPLSLFGGEYVPRLREVSLVGVHVDWDNSPLQNLHRLEFKYHASDVMPTIHQFVAILNNCPELVDLSIIGWGPVLDPPDTTTVTTIPLHNLEKLSFGFIDMEYSTTLLSLFHLPALKEVFLEDVSKTVNPLETHDSSDILEWLYTSQPTQRASFSGPLTLTNPIPLQHVRDLQLQSVRSTEDHFARFFRCFPHLSKLWCSDVPDEALLALSPQTEEPTRRSGSNVHCVCPSLTDLYFQDANEAILVEMVVNRSVCGSGKPFKNVTIEYVRNACPPSSSDVHARLDKSGIKVVGSPNTSEASDSE